MQHNDYRRLNNYVNNYNQIRVNKASSNFIKNSSIATQGKSYVYNSEISSNLLNENKKPIKTTNLNNNKNQVNNKKIIKSIYKSGSTKHMFMRQLQKYPEIKTKNNSPKIYNGTNLNKKLKASRSFIVNNINNSPSNYINTNPFIYNNTNFIFDNSNSNDIKNMKKFNGIYDKIPMKIIIKQENDNKKQDYNYFYTKMPTKKLPPNSQRLPKNDIDNRNNFVKRIIGNKDLNKIYKYNYFQSAIQKNDSNELELFNTNDHLKTDKNINNNYIFKNNCNKNIDRRRCLLENKNLSKSNKTFKNNEFLSNFSQKLYKSDLFSNLAFFCDKIEDICLDIYKNYFIIFINNLKNYQKNTSNTNRALLLKRLFEKKTHIRRSTTDDELDQKYLSKENSYSKIQTDNNINQDKIVDFQRNINYNLENINQDDYIKVFNGLFNKSLNYEQKRACSPIGTNTNLNLNMGDVYVKTEGNNIFTNNVSSFNKDRSDKEKLKEYNINEYIKENNNNSFKRNYYSALINENNRNYNRSFDKSTKNNENMKNFYINTEFLDNKNSSENKDKENDNICREIYDLNTTNFRVYSKPVLTKNSSKVFEINKNEINNNTILKRNKIYDSKTYFNLTRKKSEECIHRNQKEPKEKIIKNVYTRDKRLHVFIKYIYFTFNRTNNTKIKSKELSLLKLLKIKNKNFDSDIRDINNEYSQNVTSFNQKLYKIEKGISIEISANSNKNKNINKYLLNAVIFLTNLLNNVFEKNDKRLLNYFILNLNSNDGTSEKLNQRINVNRAKIIPFKKIIPVNSYNGHLNNNKNGRFKNGVQLNYSDYKNKKTYNNKNLEKTYSEPNDDKHLRDKSSPSYDNDTYKNKTTELGNNLCVTEVQSPRIVTKIKIVNIINKDENNLEANEDKINDKTENKEIKNEKNKDNKIESRLEKLKKLKLGKLFNNLDHDNKIINIIKNQFLDWNTKNTENQENSKFSEKKYSIRTFANEKYGSRDKEEYDVVNEKNNNKDDDKRDETEELKKSLINFALRLKNKEEEKK